MVIPKRGCRGTMSKLAFESCYHASDSDEDNDDIDDNDNDQLTSTANTHNDNEQC